MYESPSDQPPVGSSLRAFSYRVKSLDDVQKAGVSFRLLLRD